MGGISSPVCSLGHSRETEQILKYASWWGGLGYINEVSGLLRDSEFYPVTPVFSSESLVEFLFLESCSVLLSVLLVTRNTPQRLMHCPHKLLFCLLKGTDHSCTKFGECLLLVTSTLNTQLSDTPCM